VSSLPPFVKRGRNCYGHHCRSAAGFFECVSANILKGQVAKKRKETCFSKCDHESVVFKTSESNVTGVCGTSSIFH
jgi:hypothetical protein